MRFFLLQWKCEIGGMIFQIPFPASSSKGPRCPRAGVIHILLTRGLLEGSGSGFQCMNCPLRKNSVRNSLSRMRKKCPPCLPCVSPKPTLWHWKMIFYRKCAQTQTSHLSMKPSKWSFVKHVFFCCPVHSSCSDSSSVGSQKEGGSPASGRDPRRSSGSTSYSQVEWTRAQWCNDAKGHVVTRPQLHEKPLAETVLMERTWNVRCLFRNTTNVENAAVYMPDH